MLSTGGAVKRSSRDLKEPSLKASTLKNTTGINFKAGHCPVYLLHGFILAGARDIEAQIKFTTRC